MARRASRRTELKQPLRNRLSFVRRALSSQPREQSHRRRKRLVVLLATCLMKSPRQLSISTEQSRTPPLDAPTIAFSIRSLQSPAPCCATHSVTNTPSLQHRLSGSSPFNSASACCRVNSSLATAAKPCKFSLAARFSGEPTNSPCTSSASAATAEAASEARASTLACVRPSAATEERTGADDSEPSES